LLEDPGDPEEVLGPLLAREIAPSAPEGVARRLDRPIHVLGGAAGDLRQRLLGCGVHGREDAAIRGLHLAAADEQAVAVLELDDVARFGGGRILPRNRLTVSHAPAGRRTGCCRCDRALLARPGGHAGIIAFDAWSPVRSRRAQLSG